MKEKIKNFWDTHKNVIIGGVIGGCVGVGGYLLYSKGMKTGINNGGISMFDYIYTTELTCRSRIINKDNKIINVLTKTPLSDDIIKALTGCESMEQCHKVLCELGNYVVKI